MVDCPLCSGYGTILLRDRESDDERETPCTACMAVVPLVYGAFITRPPADLEKELDAVVKRTMEHFRD